MVIGYKKRFSWGAETDFKRKIQQGIKKHTIRADVKNRWKPGMKIHHAHGTRTKYYEQFAEGLCVSVQKIKIIHLAGKASVYVDNNLVGHYAKLNGFTGYQRLKMLAKNDGFDSVDDFFMWFDADFEGSIIHWTDLKY